MGNDRTATSAMPWSSLLGGIREYAIFTLDPEGVIDSWNVGVRELLGYEEQEFVGQHGSIIFTDEDRAEDAVQREFDRAREGGEAMDDRWHVRKDGARFWANGIMHAVRNEAGVLTGYLKIMRDQTEKRAAAAMLEQNRTLITAILDSLPGVFYLFDGQRFVRWNEEIERVTGFSAEELTAATPEDLLVEGERAREHIDDVLRSGRRSLEGHLRTKDGRAIPYLFTSHRVVLDDQPFILGLGIENRDQVHSHQLLERRAREQTTFAELAAATLSSIDVPQVFDLAVRRVRETLGTQQVRITELSEGDTAIATPAKGVGISAPIHGHGRTFGFLEAVSERGDEFSRDDADFLAAVGNFLAGAVEQQRLHRELEHRAETDDLTGLLKRVAFEHRLVAALGRAERQGTKVAVMFIDLDRFKEVNDSLGHQAGDEVLKEVSQRLLEAVRSWDAVARHGGDEFVLFLPDINERAEVTHVAERLFETLQAPFNVDGHELTVGATIGIACYPDDGKDAGELLRVADTALYEGKAEGRNRFHFFGQAKK